MTLATLPRPLRGIVPPLVTPLSDQDRLDPAGLERLIDRVIEGGVHGLFILGTTGEGPSLAYALRHQLIELVCDRVGGRVPVLVGITDTALGESLELAQRAYDSGASAVVAAPPYYLALSQQELGDYFEHLARHVALPLFLYNMPSCTKVSIDPETVRRLFELEGVVGLKDSSGDLDYVRTVVDVVRHRPELTLLVGPEELLAESVALGAHGGVNGGANMFPGLYVALYEAAAAGDSNSVARFHEQITKISRSIYCVGRDASRHIKGIKCALSCLGVCDDYVAQPFRRFEGADREAIGRYVDEMSQTVGDTVRSM
jgi:4-hydroxy-tetrahydrodipicolinate synthase